MAALLQRAEPLTEPPWRLSEALNYKLAELKGMGVQVQWIECSHEDLTALIVEGDDDAISLDPDPAVDRAWYGDVEIRHVPTRPFTWVFVVGDDPSGEMSAHIISPPDPE